MIVSIRVVIASVRVLNSVQWYTSGVVPGTKYRGTCNGNLSTRNSYSKEVCMGVGFINMTDSVISVLYEFIQV